MLPLRDKVTVIKAGETTDPYSGETTFDWSNPTTVATLPAYVGYSATALVNDALASRTELVSELSAVIRPYDLDPITNRLQWRGDTYTIDGPPKVRMRNGRPHHHTIALKQVEG